MHKRSHVPIQGQEKEDLQEMVEEENQKEGNQVLRQEG
jgi:hypothetical protein